MEVKPLTIPQIHGIFSKQTKSKIFLELQILDQLIKYGDKDVKH